MIEKTENKLYEKFGLTENPFKTHYGYIPEHSFWAGSKEVKKQIEGLINDIIHARMQQYAILCGEYGTGKSYSLLYFYQNLNQNTSNQSVIGLYVENPGNSLHQFYRSLIQSVGSERLINLGKKLVGKAACLEMQEILDKNRENEDFNTFMEKTQRTLSFDYLWPKVASLGEILNDDLAKSLTWLGSDAGENKQYAWKWLTAAHLTSYEMRQAKLSRYLEGSAIAEVLSQLLHLINSELKKAIIIMVDEFEDLLAIKDETMRISFLRGLRRLIDGSPRAFGVFIACTAEGWRDGLLAYHPLASRLLKENFIPLNEFDQEMTQEFIENYLKRYRTRKTPKFFPFTKDAIESIFKATHGNPREIVKTCRICLRMKLDEAGDQITASSVEKYIGGKTHNLL